MWKFVCLSLVVGACGTDYRTEPDGGTQAAPTSFAAIREDVFATSCGFGSCHAGKTPAAHLDLQGGDVCAALVSHQSCLFPNRSLVVPGKPEQSFLLDKLKGNALDDEPAGDCAETNERMPWGAPALDAETLARIESWIRAGAPCERSGEAPPDAGTGTGMPAEVSGITADATTIRAGESTHVTITLAQPAPTGGQLIDLDVDDPTVLAVPSAVHVAAGVSIVDVAVIGKRPARPVAITAATHSVAIGVTGLALSEIEYDPVSTDDGNEWIEIANTSDVAIDLSAYSLGSGRTSYTYSLAQLSGTIPAHGCFVVGGPSGSGPVYGQTFNFSPDLMNGSSTTGQAVGFALFDTSITHVDPSTLPLDAVLCGVNNTAGLRDASGHVLTPACPDVAAGHSVSRSSSTWADQPLPTPNHCFVQ
jgi:hypothetical protein